MDYTIDGIPDYQLRNHARMQNFSSMSMLLQAFKKISLRSNNYNNRYEKCGFDRTSKVQEENQNNIIISVIISVALIVAKLATFQRTVNSASETGDLVLNAVRWVTE